MGNIFQNGVSCKVSIFVLVCQNFEHFSTNVICFKRITIFFNVKTCFHRANIIVSYKIFEKHFVTDDR